MIENHEEDIEDWYMNNYEEDPLHYICGEKVLKGSDTGNDTGFSNKILNILDSPLCAAYLSLPSQQRRHFMHC